MASVAESSRSLAPTATSGGLCRARWTLGRRELCSAWSCPFWEEGGAVVDPGCVVERLALDVEGHPQLAWALLHVLDMLERARTADERAGAYALLDRLVPSAREEGDDHGARQPAARVLDA
jgi:hypothetical protein